MNLFIPLADYFVPVSHQGPVTLLSTDTYLFFLREGFKKENDSLQAQLLDSLLSQTPYPLSLRCSCSLWPLTLQSLKCI